MKNFEKPDNKQETSVVCTKCNLQCLVPRRVVRRRLGDKFRTFVRQSVYIMHISFCIMNRRAIGSLIKIQTRP